MFEMKSMGKVLVTGATGFLGGRIVERLILEERAEVHVLLRLQGRASRIASLPVKYHMGDVTDERAFAEAARGCDLVIHCASSLEHGLAPKQTSTCRGTMVAAQVSSEVGARLVHISSCAVYGCPDQPEIDENAPLQPRHRGDTYALAKITAEQFLRSYAKEHSLKAAVLQPTMIYGPFSSEWTTVPLAMLSAADVAMPLGDKSICNAVYVDDVVTAAFLVADRCDVSCPSYLINGDDLPTWTEFLSRYAALGTVGKMVPLSAGDMKKLAATATQSRSLWRAVVKLMRENSAARSTILSTSVVSGILGLLHKITPASAFERFRKYLGRHNTASGPVTGFPQPSALPLHLPPRHFLDLTNHSFKFSNGKARRELGFCPAYDLQTAFTVISKWARWSRLLS